MININSYKLTPAITATWGDITGNISNQSDLMSTLGSYATESWVSSQQFATESWVSDQGYLTSVPSEYATQSWVSEQGYLTSTALTGYATESWVSEQGYLTSIPSEYATQSWVSEQGYLTSSALEGYATESWVSDQGYLTSIPSEYATQSWVSEQGYLTSTALTGYATQSWVSEQGYLTEHQSLEGYATESWVSGQGYLTEHQSLKTVNNESLVGEGNIDIEALTPEQEAAVGLIQNPSEGYLKYAFYQNKNTVKWIDAPAVSDTSTLSNKDLAVINGLLYMLDRTVGDLYVFNDDKYEFDYIGNSGKAVATYTPLFMWADSQGRAYIANELKIDLTTGLATGWPMGGNFVYHASSATHNIVQQDGVTYMISYTDSCAYIFNEQTQLFDSSIPCSGFPEQNFYRYCSMIDGKYVYGRNGNMYEFQVSNGSAQFVEVQTPYYPLSWTYNGTEYSTTGQYVRPLGDTYALLGYPGNNIVFVLENGTWVPTTFDVSGATFTNHPSGVAYGNMWFGYGYGSDGRGKVLVWNFYEDKTFYGWTSDIEDRLTALETSVGQAETISNEILG